MVNLNGKKYFEECLTSLLTQDYPHYEIVLVDNGSTDGSVELFQAAASRIRPDLTLKIIRNSTNRGFAEANNQGVSASTGEYLAFVSNDIRLQMDWLRRMAETIRPNKQIACIQSHLRQLANPHLVDNIGGELDVLGMNHPARPADPYCEPFYVEFCATILRRSVLNKTAGLFDPQYFVFFEDVDFCWRARLAGCKVLLVNSPTAFHVRGGTAAGTVMRKQPFHAFLTARNRLTTLFRNYSEVSLARWMILALAVEFCIALWLALKRDPRGRYVLMGIAFFLWGMPGSLKHRRVVRRMRRVDETSITRSMVKASKGLRDILSYRSQV